MLCPNQEKIHTRLPLERLAEADLAHLKSNLPVATDAWEVGRESFKRLPSRTPVQRFLEKVVIHEPTGCWIWMSVRTPVGYGRFTLNGKKFGAHRASVILFKGENPDGLYVCHKCDTPACVNPDHLFLGTCQDNTDDCVAKGRRNYEHGESRYNAKLSNKDVISIWVMWYVFGFTLNRIASLFMVHTSTVGNILYCKKHWMELKAIIAGSDGWAALHDYGI